MTIDVRQVQLQAPASNTTQDFTVSGFGTPKAALILTGYGPTSDTPHARLNTAFFDGINTRSVGYSESTGATANGSQSRSWASTTLAVYTTTAGTSASRSATAAFITDGVRLTWAGSTGDRPYVTVILFAGNFNVVVGSADLTPGGTVNVTTTGVDPNFIITHNRFLSADFNGGMGRYNFGFAHDNGSSIDQLSAGVRLNAVAPDPNDWNADISNTKIIANQTDGYTFTAMGTEQFSVAADAGLFSSADVIYMAFELNDDVDIFSASTPTASGDWDPVTLSFAPQYVFMVTTAHTAIPNSESGSADAVEGIGLYSVNDDGEEHGVYVTHQDNVTTQAARSKTPTRFEIVTADASGNYDILVSGDSPTFDSDGIVFADANFSHDSTARYVIGFAIGGAGGSSSPIPVLHNVYRQLGFQ